MCGIFAYFQSGADQPTTDVKCADQIRHRGPDETRKITINNNLGNIHLVFHRLAINGMTAAASQPFVSEDQSVYLLANGEIYNHIGIKNCALRPDECPKSTSDCEVILNLYLKMGIEDTIEYLDGEFAFCIVDLRINRIFVGRDHIGVRALYYLNEPGKFAVCSELKGLTDLSSSEPGQHKLIDQFPNRHYGVYDMTTGQFDVLPYNTFFKQDVDCHDDLEGETTNGFLHDSHIYHIRMLLGQAVDKRLMCDRKTSSGLPAVGAFLSGGLDSSLIAALAQDSMRKSGPIHTFSIGFQDAPDLLAARTVAQHIGSIHHEHVVTRDYMLSLLPEVIRQIESYDITSVRASAFMYALSKYIREQHQEIVVLLSGEGPDEASGSYMYFYNAPSHEEFKTETFRLLEDMRYFDCLRGDKATAGHSLEIRVPFLDRSFLNYYMLYVHPRFKMIPRNADGSGGIEKYILRKSFDGLQGSDGRPLLPVSIIWRAKEAMSDGVSNRNEGASWFQIIQEHIRNIRQASATSLAHAFKDKTSPLGIDLEREWYLEIFNHYYPGCSHLVPYYWLPRWSYDATGAPVKDPSARVLSVYRWGT
jgi:asparagine synthase (glutamine-hydrolysing)